MQAAILAAVDTHIDHDRALLDPLAPNQARLAGSDDHQVGALDVGGQVLGESVADGDGGAGKQQFEGHRPADDVGGTHHDRLHPVQVAAGLLEQPHYPVGRAGAQARPANRQAADIGRMKAVDILVGIDALDDRVGAQVVRQGQLHQDAVDARIGVELVDQRIELRLGNGLVEVVGKRLDAELAAGLDLVRHVDRRGRIVAHLHHGEPGPAVAGFGIGGDGLGKPGADGGADGSPVEECCSHGTRRLRERRDCRTRPRRR